MHGRGGLDLPSRELESKQLITAIAIQQSIIDLTKSYRENKARLLILEKIWDSIGKIIDSISDCVKFSAFAAKPKTSNGKDNFFSPEGSYTQETRRSEFELSFET